MGTRAPFEKGVEHVANARVWGRLLPHTPLNHFTVQYAYFLYIPLLNHDLCKPKSTMFVYFSHTGDCSFFKVNTYDTTELTICLGGGLLISY